MKLVTLDQVPDIPNSNGNEPADNSWQPENLLDLAANPPEPPSIGGLLYPGKRTVLSGETESMKTWLALILAKAELDAGYPVAWVDLDAMGPGAMLERLQLLGVPDQQIATDFLYYEPSETLGPQALEQIQATVSNRGIRLFVIDAFNPFLTLHSLDPEKTTAIETFWRTYADPISQAGAAPVLLDHVVKNTENRGKYSLGSERKASGAIVHLGFRLLQPLTKGGTGKSLLTVHKDRPGYLPRPTIGRLAITSTDTGTITYAIEHDHSHDGDTYRPTVLMEKISRQLERETSALSKKQIEEIKLGKNEYVRKALDALADEGYLAKQEGPRGAHLYTTIRAYRETDDNPPTTSPRPRPDLVPELRSTRPRPSSPPLKGTRSGGDRQTGRRPTSSRAPDTAGQPIPEYDHPPIDETLQPYDEQ